MEKNVTVVDVYSRSLAFGDAKPGILRTARITGGVLVRQLDPALADMVVSAVIAEMLPAPKQQSR